MHKGQPLTDADRQSWLEAILERASSHPQDPGSRYLVVTCSALKCEYRDTLRHGCRQCGDIKVRFLFLDAPEAVLKQRAEARKGQFASSSLVPTQFQALERPGIDEQDTMVLSVIPPLDEAKSDDLNLVSEML
jgi:gluconokinase